MLVRPIQGGRDLEKERGGRAGEDRGWGGGGGSHLGLPSQAQPSRCKGGAGDSVPGGCGVSGPDTESIAPERGAGAGAPVVPASPGSCTLPGRGEGGGRRAAGRASFAHHPRAAHRPRPRTASSPTGGPVLGSRGRRRCRGSSYPRGGGLRSRSFLPWPPFRTGLGRRSTRPLSLQRPARPATPRGAAPGSGEGGKRQARSLPTCGLSLRGEGSTDPRLGAPPAVGSDRDSVLDGGDLARGLPGFAREAWGEPGPHRRWEPRAVRAFRSKT